MSRLDGLQGNVLVGYETGHAAYLFASVTEAAAARRWLAAGIEGVTTHRRWAERAPDVTVNLAFGYDGLLAVGVPAARVEHLEAFRQGMLARAARIGDTGASAPEHWDRGACDSDVLVILTAREDGALERKLAEMRGSMDGAGLIVDHVQDAQRLPGSAEHFGFQDGFSQPSVAGGTAPRVGEGTRTRWRHWRQLAIGEFVLGYRDEGGWPPPAPLGPLADDSSFVAVRKLEQDVAAFRAYTRDTANTLGRDPLWLSAKMVGRWQNGSALARHPDAPGPSAAADPEASRFRYGEDPAGIACPLGAHVRRANPRDALGWEGRLTQRHRIIRRGMSYGRPLAPGSTVDDGVPRGLMFVCYQGALERQFEFTQAQWLNDGNALGLGGDGDPVLGPDGASGEMVIQGKPPVFLKGLPGFVRTRGGGYYLLPGLTGLAAIADGTC